MDESERELFTRTVRAAVESAADTDLTDTLRGLGWREALAADRRTAVEALFEACGEFGARPPLGQLLATELRTGGDLDGVALVLPMVGDADPPGRRDGEGILVHGMVSAPVTADHFVLVPTVEAAALQLQRAASGRLEIGPPLPLDPSLGWFEVRGRAPLQPPAARLERSAVWPGAVALGQLALAHGLVGASRRMLDLARVHALERVQFGRPIAAFQAVRHRLAESLVAIEAAAESVAAAWELGTPAAAQAAKAIAGTGARRVGRHSQQVLAGMGFTAEHPLPSFVRRTLVLDQTLGSAASLTRTIGEEVLRARGLPSPLPL